MALMVLAGLAELGGAVLVWRLPLLGALACPGCYGLTKLAPGIYAEPGAADIPALARTARARVAAFLGPLATRPTLLACQTQECHARLGNGGARALTWGTALVYLSPRGLSPTILAHELAHAEIQNPYRPDRTSERAAASMVQRRSGSTGLQRHALP